MLTENAGLENEGPSKQRLYSITDLLAVFIRLRKTHNMTQVFKDNRGSLPERHDYLHESMLADAFIA